MQNQFHMKLISLFILVTCLISGCADQVSMDSYIEQSQAQLHLYEQKLDAMKELNEEQHRLHELNFEISSLESDLNLQNANLVVARDRLAQAKEFHIGRFSGGRESDIREAVIQIQQIQNDIDRINKMLKQAKANAESSLTKMESLKNKIDH